MDRQLLAHIAILLGVYANFLNTLQFARRYRRKIERRWWVRPVLRTRSVHGAYTTLFRELKTTDEELFFQYTRMNIQQFDILHQLVEPYLRKRSVRTPLPSGLRLAACLSFLAHGDSVKSKAWQFRIGRSTMFKIVKETCHAIKEALQPLYLKTPVGEDWLNIAREFWDKWNFPNCIGAIDGKHIRIKAPPNSGTLYHNYKGFFSTVLLAVCDSQYCFLWVDIGDYGSHNDAGIFASSDLGKALDSGDINIPPPQQLPGMETQTCLCLVGDEAFPLKTYLMRPYSRRSLVSDAQRIFNYRLSRARRTIENAFGILTARWRVLQSSLCFKVDTIDTIVFALASLHNFLMTDDEHQYNRRYNPPGLVDQEGLDGEIIPGDWRNRDAGEFFNRLGRVGANSGPEAASRQRDVLADFFSSNEGAIPWQRRCI